MDVIFSNTYPSGTPDKWLDNGSFYFDLPEEALSITEQSEKLNDVNKLEVGGVLDLDLPMTDKNFWFFKDYIDPNVQGRVYDPIEVVVLASGIHPLIQNNFYFQGSSDANKTITVSLLNEDDYWFVAAQEFLINSIDYGSFVVNEANVLSNFVGYKYDEADDNLFWLPLVHYGRFWRSEDFIPGVISEDFLPWFSPQAILKRCFRQIGWTFETPLADGEWWNRLWVYILGTIDYPNKGINYQVNANYGQDVTLGGTTFNPVLGFNNTSYDPAQQHIYETTLPQGARSSFYNLTEMDSDFSIQIIGSIRNDGDGLFGFDLSVVLGGQNEPLAISNSFAIASGETLDINVTMDFNLGAFDNAQVRFINGVSESTVLQFTILQGFAVIFKPTSNRWYKGDTVPLRNLIDDYYLIDFVKGILHLGDFKVETLFQERKVRFLQTEGDTLFGDQLETYYLPDDQAVDISDRVAEESRNIEVQNDAINRYFVMKFEGNGDAYIRDREIGTDTRPIHGRFIDLGRGEKKQPKKIENPFFEPTANIVWNSKEIPALWDNTEGIRSKNIGPRIIVGVGYAPQEYPNEVEENTPFLFEQQLQTNFPIASQFSTRRFFNTDSNQYELTPYTVVYGGTDGTRQDLYEECWVFYFNQLQFSKLYQFIYFTDPVDWNDLGFRKKVKLTYSGFTSLYRLLAKRDWRPGESLPILIDLVPEPSIISAK